MENETESNKMGNNKIETGTYQATYDIDCGVSPGFGVKYPEHLERVECFAAESGESAYQHALVLAKQFAKDYLSSPKTGFTTVKLTSLRDPEREISIDKEKAVVRRSLLEHVLDLI